MLFSKKVNAWTLPGGKVDMGENPIEALIREVKEETGLIVKPSIMLGAVDYNFGVDSYVINLLFGVDIEGGVMSNQELEKHTALEYRKYEDISKIFEKLFEAQNILHKTTSRSNL